MKLLSSTAASELATDLRRFLYVTSLLAAMSVTGCVMIPPMFYPRTGAHGVVVDQYNRPVPNAPMQASWEPHRLLYMFAPSYQEDFEAGPDGSWTFYVRKVDQYLYIRAFPPAGYESAGIQLRGAKVWRWTCPTNNFVLHLRKIDDGGNPKKGQ